ncbi:MAG: hypothetical protein E7359_03790 [Clostridiales bacterium]|nr:hypothetical protein [Clostridiales bacterium]
MDKKFEAINLTYQSAKSIITVIDNFVLDIKNEKLQKLCTKTLNELEVIADECRLIMKSNKLEIEDIGFFEKYQNLISLKIANLKKKTTFEIASNIYLSVVETLPNLYKALSENEETSEIVKKLISLNEDFSQNLKKFFIAS